MLKSTIELTRKLVEMPSISTNSNLEVNKFIDEYLRIHGAKTELTTDPSGGKANIFATIGPDVDGGIVLSGHTDVVPVEGQKWTSDPFVMRQEGDHLIGRGTCDMKGFIACTLAIAPEFAKADLKRPIHFAFTYDEEIGCHGAKVMLGALKKSGRKPAIVLIGEPTGMKVIEGHKGCCENTTRFMGLEGHSSMPSSGVNAVEYAAQYIGELMDIAEALQKRTPHPYPFNPPWTTLTVGSVRGGIAHNVIPNSCKVDWSFRPVCREDKEYVRNRIDRYGDEVLVPKMQAVYPEAGMETEVVGDVVGFEPHPRSDAVAMAQELTGENSVGLVPFGTEAGLFQEMDISAVVCGPGYIGQAHKPDEFVDIGQLEACLTMLGKLIPKLSA